MTEPQFLFFAGPLLLYIIGLVSIVFTVFFYLEFKEKRAKFKNQYIQQREIDALKKENQDLKKPIKFESNKNFIG